MRICSQRFRTFYQGLAPIEPTSGKNSPRLEVLNWLCQFVYDLTSPRYIALVFHILSMMIKGGLVKILKIKITK